jgi:hypothetical protein
MLATAAFRVFVLSWLIAGCAGVKTDRDAAMERAQAYLAAHPNLAPTAAEAIRSNSVRKGMTMEQVVAAWGPPADEVEFRDGEVQFVYFGCDWPHVCDTRHTSPEKLYQSRAQFENGVVVDWRR